MPSPVSRDRDDHVRAVDPSRHRDLAFVGVPDRVVEQVDQDLADPERVHVEGRQVGGQVDPQAQPGLVEEGAERRAGLLDDLRRARPAASGAPAGARRPG